MASGGVRSGPMIDAPCPACPRNEDGTPVRHEILVRLGATPMLACPSVKSDALRYRDGWTAIVTGAAPK